MFSKKTLSFPGHCVLFSCAFHIFGRLSVFINMIHLLIIDNDLSFIWGFLIVFDEEQFLWGVIYSASGGLVVI